ncbi:MAG TPA: hypothetical protein VFA07_18535 [Chthonomonadaceae bacterium]|nr:hypothetical protein [Chthonomonadaceae bacterium]
MFSTSYGNVTVTCPGTYSKNDGTDPVATATLTYSDSDNPPDNSALNYIQNAVSVYTVAGSGSTTFALDNPVGTDTVLTTYQPLWRTVDKPQLWRYLYNESDLDFYTGSLTDTSGTSSAPLYWKFHITGPANSGPYTYKIARAYKAYIDVSLPSGNKTTASMSTPLQSYNTGLLTGPFTSSPGEWGTSSLVYSTSNDIVVTNLMIGSTGIVNLYVSTWSNASISNSGTNNTTESVQAEARYEVKFYSLTG